MRRFCFYAFAMTVFGLLPSINSNAQNVSLSGRIPDTVRVSNLSAVIDFNTHYSGSHHADCYYGICLSEDDPFFTDQDTVFHERSTLFHEGTRTGNFTVTLTGLKDKTTYYYRVFMNVFGKEGTLDGSFVTDMISDRYPKEYVDLGLSVMWATCNVGAKCPEEFGDYFAWGETKPKDNYWWDTYFDDMSGKDNFLGTTISVFSKYNNEGGLTILTPEDDAAYVNWGPDWRMATYNELCELRDSCIWTWFEIGNSEFNGVAGYKVQGRKEGYTDKFIFLPAAGNRSGIGIGNAGVFGCYWSTSIDPDFSNNGQELVFNTGNFLLLPLFREAGYSIRPVWGRYVDAADVELNRTELELAEDAVYTLKATVVPALAKDQRITWSSDNHVVATVDPYGRVKAVSRGVCTITATCGTLKTTCKVTVKTIKPEYVDMGLSVKWATFNIGASHPEDFGEYFAWGEVTSSTYSSWSTYSDSPQGDGKSFSKYYFNGGMTSLGKDDVAHERWGGTWRMPSYAEFQELLDNCTCTWTVQNGVNGIVFESKINGNTVFFPAAGRYQVGLICSNSAVDYWSSSLYTGNLNDYIDMTRNQYAWCMDYYSYDRRPTMGSGLRYQARPVRPVCP